MTLYATDLDGTLLDANAKLSQRSAALYRNLTDQGALISFITARTPATVEPILASAKPRYPLVAMTGATIWNPATRLYDSVIYHSPTDALTINEICRDLGVHPFIYTMPKGGNNLTVYHEATDLSAIEKSFVEERTISDLKTFQLHRHAPVNFEQDTVLFFAMGDPEKIEATAKAIRAATPCYASCYPDTYNPNIRLLEVFAPKVSKAEGLIRLRHLLKADRVVAFGDNLNDIPMLKGADIAVAVENAHPEVKAVADIVIPPNTTDSVMQFISNDFEI